MRYEVDSISAAIVRNNNKCILCRRCVAVCANVQKVGVIGASRCAVSRPHIDSPFDMQLWPDAACINCGQCITACPAGALTEKDAIDRRLGRAG